MVRHQLTAPCVCVVYALHMYDIVRPHISDPTTCPLLEKNVGPAGALASTAAVWSRHGLAKASLPSQSINRI